MDFEELQQKGADGEVDGMNADGDDYENGIGSRLRNKFKKRIVSNIGKTSIGKAFRKARNADGIEELQMMNAGGDEVTIEPNKFVKMAVWSAIALGTGLFILHAYATLSKIKKA
jgi:hypothetical protein